MSSLSLPVAAELLWQEKCLQELIWVTQCLVAIALSSVSTTDLCADVEL